MNDLGEIDFHQALGVLQELINQRVYVHVGSSTGPEEALGVVGHLTADTTMAEPCDEDQFDFAIDESGNFSIARHEFITAWRTDSGVDFELGKPGAVVNLSIERFAQR